MNKKILLITGSLLIILAIGASGCDSFSPPSRTTSGSVISGQNTGIWVHGEGKVTVVPDIAILTLGVEAQEDTVAEAMANASHAMAKVGTALMESGIEGKDIQTQYFNIRQRTTWDNRNEEEIITGYRVTNKVIVKIRTAAHESVTLDYKASNIIDTVVKAGGDLIRIDSFNFSMEDPAIYYDEAREKALADARDKAEQIADTAGVRLGEPTYITESISYYPTPYQVTYSMGVPVPTAEPGVSISTGETEITILVQVAYSIN